MNIALFSWEYPPQIVGGLGTYTFELSREIAKRGHSISVFTMNSGSLKTRESIDGIEIHRPKLIDIADALPEFQTEEFRRTGTAAGFFSDILMYNILASAKMVNELIAEEGRRFDILSVHDWLSSIAGMSIKKATGIPMVFHIHSTEKGRSLGNGSKIISELELKASRAADRIITVSHAMRDELISYGFPHEKIEVVWNGVNPGKYSAAALPPEGIKLVRANYGITDEMQMILFIGRLTAVKGIDRLIMAMPQVFARNPSAKLVVVGRGDLEGELPGLAKSLGISERVSFNFTMLPEPDRILHYAAADVATFPSLYEPFGIVALEAMSMGKPVVVGARGVSGMREIVVASGPNQCGYHINPYDPNDIAWGLNNLLSDKAHMLLLGRNARERVLSEFTWEKVGDRCLSIYSEVLEGARTAKS